MTVVFDGYEGPLMSSSEEEATVASASFNDFF